MFRGLGVPHWKTYLQVIILILVSVGLVVVGYGLSGCGKYFGFADSSIDVLPKPRPKEELKVKITSGGDSYDNPASPGDSVTRTIRVKRDGGDPSDKVEIIYQPSNIAEGIDFGKHEAYWHEGLKAYVIHNVPLNTEVVITYFVGTPRYGGIYYNTLDNVQADLVGNSEVDGYATFESRVEIEPDELGNHSRSLTGSGGLAQGQTPSKDTLAAADDYYIWELGLWYFNDDQKMTPEMCQAWFDYWQSGNAYFALRFQELGATPAYTDSYTLPVVFRGAYSPTMSLVDNSDYLFTRVVTAPMNYRPEAFEFLANELPEADGEHWIALDAPTTPKAICPDTLDIPGGDWTFYISFALDFGEQDDACEECILPLYYCYESEEPAFMQPLVTTMLGEGGHEPVYQGMGTTCFGPQPLRLRDWSSPDPPDISFEFHDTNFDYITTTQTISYVHRLWNLGTDPVTVSFDFTSTLGIPWEVYSGTKAGPTAPLVGSLTLPEKYLTKRIWMVADVPEGTQGLETLSITATDVASPTLSMSTSDLLWIGEWIEPPPKPSEDYKIYLPLVVK